MPIKKYTITSIEQGMSPLYFNMPEGSYLASLGIDPDWPAHTTTSLGSGVKTGGAITPTYYSKFSGVEIDGFPLWIVTQPKTENSYVYTSTGKLHSFDNTIAMRAKDEKNTNFPIAVTNGAGGGAAYYNNFIYLAASDDISQYGGMDQGASIALTTDVWTGAKFGKGALTNTTYPLIRGTYMPNHPMHVHGDNSLYFGDVVNGAGVLHKIKTKKVTIEGDTDDGSVFNAIDLPNGYYPAAIESYGTDLVIAAFQGSSNIINQGPAALFFWDTFSDTFYRQVTMLDPYITALKNNNGNLYIFSGSGNTGMRLSVYAGDDSVKQIGFFGDGVPPMAGAVDSYGERISWGSPTTFPQATAGVVCRGSKDSRIKSGIHHVARCTSAGSTPTVTAIKHVQQASGIYPRLIIGWGDDSAKGLDKISSAAAASNYFCGPVFIPGGRSFRIKEIRLPLAEPVAANVVIDAYIVTDGSSTQTALTQINNTNNPGQQIVYFDSPAFKDFPLMYNDFYLQLVFSGTVYRSVVFPIEITVEIIET